MEVKVNEKAPSFNLPDQNGNFHELYDYKGRFVLLYFYPKDDTPGCTAEACSIRDNYDKFSDLGIAVIGVSADSTSSHKKFAEKYRLPFTLLSDTKKEAIAAYGADGIIFAKRITYLISPGGVIVKRYERVTPATHAEELLADLKLMKIK